MKPKNPSGAKGGQDGRAPQSRQKRRGTPLPIALARLLGTMLGATPKRAKGPPPASKQPVQPETTIPVEQEVEVLMSENNKLPPEGPEEVAPKEEIAGTRDVEETPATEANRRAADILARALSEAEAVLVSAAKEQAPISPPPEETNAADPIEEPPEPEPSPLLETQELLRMLTEHFDHALDRMADERRILIDEVQSAGRSAREHTKRALDRLEQDRRSFNEQVASLTHALEGLERRIDDLSRAALQPRHAPAAPPVEEETVPEDTEPAFAPGQDGVALVISAVPGFQGLMEVQRALSRVPAIEGASVERYFDGEARIVLMLRESITAGRLLEALTQGTGQQFQLDESRPESMRMRVRFQGPLL